MKISKLKVIGHCDGDEKQMITQNRQSTEKQIVYHLTKLTKNLWNHNMFKGELFGMDFVGLRKHKS